MTINENNQSTLAYYEQHAAEFSLQTSALNMSDIYNKFLNGLAPGSHILDAGCGAGRDTLAFHKLGYRVCAFDASPALVDIAANATGQNVICSTFDNFTSSQPFDGIWACASLLHTVDNKLTATVSHLSQYLSVGGVFYMSFKYGTGNRLQGERQFTDMNEKSIAKLIDSVSHLAISDQWVTGDVREGNNQSWLNVIVKRIYSNGES
ncbi:MAG: 2-polyprenyl-3-methyl-5-hydroxy-6-metoxy-1,4-benzoquinol methylase [Oleiphilaceae bacterium]|jgi:2-polyprenyl-3-methyl-5-hydroxy-6-metoxy-1,4-benzoquinol methylase